MISRRQFVGSLAGSVSATALLSSKLSLAALPGERRLVVIILWGGLDGLAAVPPYGDPNYEKARGHLALPSPGEEDGILDLDGTFGLHRSLEPLYHMYERGEFLALHAVATPYDARSHFDAQDVLENGSARTGGLRDGWLNRAIGALDHGSDPALGLALGGSVPLIMRGEVNVASWSPNVLPLPDADLLAQIERLWRHDALLGPSLAQGLSMQEPHKMPMAFGNRKDALRGPRAFLTLAEKAGEFLARPEGPRIAVLEMGGWDTHANQGRTTGRLASRLQAFADGIVRLRSSLGPAWSQTAVLAVTEFGRTAAPNGTNGTDHGVAGAAFLLGGAVAGGRVVTDWPGLKESQLHEGRDLRPTIDLRSVFKGVLHDHLEIAATALEGQVFPESRSSLPLKSLIRA